MGGLNRLEIGCSKIALVVDRRKAQIQIGNHELSHAQESYMHRKKIKPIHGSHPPSMSNPETKKAPNREKMVHTTGDLILW